MKRKPFILRESVVRLGKPERVDREAGVLYGVKILGLESENRRIYESQAALDAVKLYEGLAVNVDHPDKPDDPRSARDRFGWFENVRPAAEGGLRGDFHLVNPLTELSINLMNAAEQKPDLYGFSHNAEGEGHTRADGVYVVERITRVRSVDLVAEPATTGGLFEGKAVKKTIREFLTEVTLPKLKAAKNKSAKKVARFVEAMDDDVALMDMDAPAEDGDWKADLTAAIGKLTSGEDADSHDLAKKILAMLHPGKAAADGEADMDLGEGEEEEEEEEEELEEGSDGLRGGNQKGQLRAMNSDGTKGSNGDGGDHHPKHSESRQSKPRATASKIRDLQEQLSALKADKEKAELKEFIRAECLKRKIECDTHLLEHSLVLADRKRIGSHLDWLQKQGVQQKRQGPRSIPSGGFQFTESREFDPEKVNSVESFIECLKAP